MSETSLVAQKLIIIHLHHISSVSAKDAQFLQSFPRSYFSTSLMESPSSFTELEMTEKVSETEVLIFLD